MEPDRGWRRHAGKWRFALACALLALALAGALLRATSFTTALGVRVGQPWAMGDFRNVVYCPAVSFLRGGNPYDHQQLRTVCPRISGFPPFAPATLLLHAPFGLLGEPASARLYAAWTVLLTLVLAALALHLNGVRPTRTAVILVMACVLLSRPGQWNLLLGNIAVELTLATYVALHYAGRSDGLSAIGLAVAAIKPSFGVPLGLLMLARRDGRAVGLGVALAAAMNLPLLLVLADRAGGLGALAHIAAVARGRWGESVAQTAITSAYRIDLPAFLARLSGHVMTGSAELVIGLAVIGAAAAAIIRLGRRPDQPARRFSSDLICIAMLLSIYHLGYDLILLTAAAVALAGGTLPAWVAPRFRRALLIGVAILAANYLTAETILVHLRDHRLWLLVASINCGLLLLLFTGYVIQAFRAPPAGTHPA